jgi:hypothetical protein
MTPPPGVLHDAALRALAMAMPEGAPSQVPGEHRS